MEQQIVTKATDLFATFCPAIFSNGSKIAEILNRIKNTCIEILHTEEGKKLVSDGKELAKMVSTENDFRGIIKNFFQLAKNWAEDPIVMLAVFVLTTAMLIACIFLAPEATVAVWVARLTSALFAIFSSFGCVEMKMKEFFARPSLEL